MKKFGLLLIFLFLSPRCFTQTTLSAGDIAIVGFNFDNPDDFAFVLLNDIEASTIIKFTDDGWKSVNAFRGSEGILTYTSPSAITAGTVIDYSTNSSHFSSSGSFSLSAGGDQILVYQGTESSPNFVYALNSEQTGWQDDAIDAQTSALPTGLTNSTSAVAIDEVDNGYYSGGPNSDLSVLRTNIGNQSNWTTSNSTRYDLETIFSDPLPVELSSFSAKIFYNGIKLNWTTETEVSNYGFEIQRSSSNVQSLEWMEIGFVEGHGNSNSPKEYSFIDENVTGGKYSYRLKQIDNDGKFEYSKVIEIDVGIPVEYELSQNYPNPFNPSTTIKFSIPGKGNVKLMVYNILGEEIAILLNEVKEAGVHTINYSAPDMTSGIYFYKIEAHNFVAVKKMQLVK